MTLKDLERVLYFENYIVVEPGLTPLKEYQLLTEEEYVMAQDEYGEDTFTAMIGAEAIREILASLDLEAAFRESCVRKSLRAPLRAQAYQAWQASEDRRGLHRIWQPSRMDDHDHRSGHSA